MAFNVTVIQEIVQGITTLGPDMVSLIGAYIAVGVIGAFGGFVTLMLKRVLTKI